MSRIRHRRTILLTIAQPEANHNGGAVKFGPDGFLYIGMGDGGGGNDQHGTIGNAQDKTSLLGQDPAHRCRHGGNPYAIPPGNPFATGVGGRPEIFAIGVRNPWRLSFDRVTGDFWIGDVGQGAVEEVDRLAGRNRRRHQLRLADHGGQRMHGPGRAVSMQRSRRSRRRSSTYTHSLGCSITGGYVYRGTAVPALVGQYLYADFCTGRIWAAQRAGAGPWVPTELGATGLSRSDVRRGRGGRTLLRQLRDGRHLPVRDATRRHAST